MNERILPEQSERVETGVVRFGEDWPGVFIRGKHANFYALALNEVLKKYTQQPQSPTENLHYEMIKLTVQNLIDLFEESHV